MRPFLPKSRASLRIGKWQWLCLVIGRSAFDLKSPSQPLRLLCQLRQPFPVEGDSVAGPRWRQCHALVEGERVLDIAVKPKAVRFEIGAIWARREQVNGDVMCPMTSGRWNASASRAIFIKAVTPPQLVTSGSG